MNYSQNASCAHLRVTYVTQSSTGGRTTGWWQCADCPTRFVPASAPAGEEPQKHWRESEEVKAHRAMFHIFYDGDVTHTEVLNHNLDILCDAVAALHSRSLEKSHD